MASLFAYARPLPGALKARAPKGKSKSRTGRARVHKQEHSLYDLFFLTAALIYILLLT